MRRPIKVRVKFLANFRDLFEAREKDIVLSSDARLRDLLRAPCDSPERRAQVLTASDEIHPQVVIMKNGTPRSRSAAWRCRSRTRR